jgi:hypothetical protein
MKISLVWVVFTSAITAIYFFHQLHPWEQALSFWWYIPWTGFMAYYFGRQDAKKEWSRKELAKELDSTRTWVGLMRMKIKLHT